MIYDPDNHGTDVFGYADDAIAQALEDYSPFTVTITNSLPAVGEDRVFYLVPKRSGNGYDKYWYIFNNVTGNREWDAFGGSSTVIVNALPATGEPDVDYILAANGEYNYYKYINNTWCLIAGASAEVLRANDNGSILTFRYGTPVQNEYPTEGFGEGEYYLDMNDFAIWAVDNDAWVKSNVLVAYPSVNKDYFIKDTSGNWAHFRYINNSFQRIAVDSYSRSETDQMLGDLDLSLTSVIDDAVSEINNTISEMANDTEIAIDGIHSAIDEVGEDMDTLGTRVGTLSSSVTTMNGRVNVVEAKVEQLDNLVTDVTESSGGITVHYRDGSTSNVNTKDATVKVEDVNKTESGITIVYTDGDTKDIKISGGGGGGTVSGSATILRITPSVSQCVYGDECEIEYNFVALDSAGDAVGSGNATWYVGNVRKATSIAAQGNNAFDIGPYLNVGTNNIKLSISVDTGGESPIVTTKTWTVTAINLRLAWDYDDSTINTADSVAIRWTPYGDLSKTTHVTIDGVERTDLETTTTRSGVQQYVVMNKLAHGSHFVTLRLSATVNSETIYSDPVSHDMIFVDETSNVPIVASSFSQTQMMQYDTVSIPIVVYDPASLTANVDLAVGGTAVAHWTNIDRTVHFWNYSPNDYGDKVLTITCGSTTKTINIHVNKLNIDNEEVTGYTFRMKSSEITGNDALRAWSSNGVDATFSNNFDWNNGGIKSEIDDDGNIRQFICVKAGTRMTINNKMFADDPRVYGKTFKIIYKIKNCRDYDAEIASCYAEGIGLRMYAHQAMFSSTGTTVSVPYGEDEYIELEFDVYPTPTETNGSFRYIMAWIDGVITTTRVYGVSDNFTQSNAAQQNIIIGSDDCDVYVYMVKAYPNYMTRNNHIINFISDAPNAQEMVKRYNRNNIIDGSGEIDYELLANKNPDCRVWLYNIPRLTQGKKDYVDGCSFQQIWEGGDQYYQITGVGRMSIQGTSSVDYLPGAANTDINFGVDGAELYDGNGRDLLSDELTVKGFKINDGSVPITYSNTKVNFASCEQVNNMCNAEWYQAFQPYERKTPRDCMEFAMGVQFINDQSGDLWDDNKYHMYSIANMGTSKKNVHIFHDTTNENECCIEVHNNLNDQCRMISDDLTNEDWSGDFYFESRYPETKKPSQAIKDGWQRFLTWMASSNPNAATGDALAEPVTYEPYTF